MYVFNIYLGSQLVHFNLPIHGKVTFGRDQINALQLSDPSIAALHASLELRVIGRRTRLVLRDQGSKEGTYVNDERVAEREILPGDSIRIGKYEVEIREVHKNHLPKIREDREQSIVFDGNPFSDQGSPSARMQALHDLSLSLADLPIPILLDRTAVTIQRGLTFDNLCIMLKGTQGLLTCTSWNREGPCARSDVPVSRSIVEHCLESGYATISKNVKLDRRFSSAISLKLQGVASAICVPLRHRDETIGIIYCTTRNSQARYNHDDLQYLMVVATQVAVAISQERAFSRVKSTAAKLNATLDHLEEGVLMCDQDFNILSSNDAARRILGRESLIGESIESVLTGFNHTFSLHHASLHEHFEFFKRTPRSSVDEPTTCAYRGTVRAVEELQKVGWDYVVSLQDTTQKLRSEQMKIAFVNRLAHKLRTPLTVAMGVISLVERELRAKEDPDLSWLLEKGNSSCEEMALLIDSFVSLASLTLREGINDESETLFSLGILLTEGIQRAIQTEDLSELRINDQLEKDSYELKVDCERVSQCFAQIIQNAAKFAGEAPVLTLTSSVDSQGLHVCFVDDGPGIPANELPRIFGVFHQVDPENTGQIPGVGLGLWWTREIIRVYDGEVTVRSPAPTTGRGTQVEIVFPLHRVQVKEATMV